MQMYIGHQALLHGHLTACPRVFDNTSVGINGRPPARRNAARHKHPESRHCLPSQTSLITAWCRRAAWARRHIVDMALRLRCSADFARVFADAGPPARDPLHANTHPCCTHVTMLRMPCAASIAAQSESCVLKALQCRRRGGAGPHAAEQAAGRDGAQRAARRRAEPPLRARSPHRRRVCGCAGGAHAIPADHQMRHVHRLNRRGNLGLTCRMGASATVRRFMPSRIGGQSISVADSHQSMMSVMAAERFADFRICWRYNSC